MNSTSDYVAIIAMVVFLISIYISYLNNKQAISAQHSKLVLGLQLDAFREIVERIGKIRFYCAENRPSTGDYYKRLQDLYEKLYLCYQRQRIFLLPKIANNVAKYQITVFEYIKSKQSDDDSNEKYYNSLVKLENLIIEDMYVFLNKFELQK
jgi:hypothetical protein